MLKDYLANGGWLSLNWLNPQTLLDYNYARSLLLYGILLVPIVFIIRWLLYFRYRRKIEVTLSTDANLRLAILTAWLRFVPGTLQSAALALFLFAMARPQQVNIRTQQVSRGIDIMLALDISESMAIEDLKPNRLEAAKEVARRFIAGRQNDRIGITIFAGDAYTLCPLTTDYSLLQEYLNMVDFNLITTSGTAIGSAIGVATNRMRESPGKSKIIILLSDGANVGGNINPATAAGLARAFNIKIYSVGVGTEGDIPLGKDLFGEMQYGPNNMDESSLRQIAITGTGQYFRATSNKTLELIFSEINRLEKSEIKTMRFTEAVDVYPVYILWGLIFLLLWLLCKSTFISNVLED